uniref:DAZ domain-containing protein n=1 Tax=Pan troglodytes TaxID=9598 RepID=A0A2I3RBC8_PANTR
MIFLSNFKKWFTIFFFFCHLSFQAFPAYPNSAVQVTTGYQFHVYNYQMPPQWPVGEQRRHILLIQIHQVRSPLGVSCLYIIIRNLWTEAYKWWYLVCLIQRRD